MKKGRSRRLGMAVLAVMCLICGYGVLHAIEQHANDSGNHRADVITINTLKVFGDLERPEVTFLHDKHTEAMEKQKKDCTTCHLSDDSFKIIPDTLNAAFSSIDPLSPKFKRLRDAGRKEVMDIYHDNCIGCHKEMASPLQKTGEKAVSKTGPIVCTECHRTEGVPQLKREPMGLDKSLHFRHAKSQEKKCEQCHHEYDAFNKKLVYVKDKEEGCRYCHRAETRTENNVKLISMRLASHISCIGCHRKQLHDKKKAGPETCAGCHDADGQKKIEVLAEVPRMERKQPDATLVKTDRKELTGRMNYVPFDHKAHEGYNNTCRACHHEKLSTCSECHTLTGSKEGGYINLEQAMHKAGAEQSCTGCHGEKQAKKECAGCHYMMSPFKMDQAADTCATCHMNSPETTVKTGKTPIPEDLEAEKKLAAQLLAARKPVKGTLPEKDIPEKVVIKSLADKYEPVDFPHRKIVTALAKGVEQSKMATYFHTQKETLCQGCHHNSPASAKPPVCGSCHGKNFEKEGSLKPGLIAAYHQQCMGCHREMEMEKPMGCTECHKEKKQS